MNSKERRQDEEPITMDSSAHCGIAHSNNNNSGHVKIIGTLDNGSTTHIQKVTQSVAPTASHKSNSSIDHLTRRH